MTRRLPLIVFLALSGAAHAQEEGIVEEGVVEEGVVEDPVEDEVAREPPGAATVSEPTAGDEAQPTDTATDDVAVATEASDEGPRLGDPIPLTRREPTLPALGVEVDLRYGLVGTGPTRFVDDIRFGVLDWLELRTSLAPYPASLMARARLGSRTGPFGAFLLEGGLAHWDAGLRLVPDSGEAEVGMRFHFEAAAAWTWSFLDRFSLYTSAHYRYRLSLLSEDDQHAIAALGMVTYDLLPWLAVSGGLGYAQTLGTPVREIAVGFVETDRPGMSHFLLRDDVHAKDLDEGLERYSVTVPLALTYGRTESFDVDLFCTPRVFPKFDVVFGAGIRWRYELAKLL